MCLGCNQIRNGPPTSLTCERRVDVRASSLRAPLVCARVARMSDLLADIMEDQEGLDLLDDSGRLRRQESIDASRPGPQYGAACKPVPLAARLRKFPTLSRALASAGRRKRARPRKARHRPGEAECRREREEWRPHRAAQASRRRQRAACTLRPVNTSLHRGGTASRPVSVSTLRP